jgi:hypothetical protein
LVTSHEQNLLPFSTFQCYALLSAESKTTQAANNKEMLDECHDIVWCHTIYVLAFKIHARTPPVFPVSRAKLPLGILSSFSAHPRLFSRVLPASRLLLRA